MVNFDSVPLDLFIVSYRIDLDTLIQ